MRIFLRLLAYTTRHKASLCLAGLFALLGVVVELARPWPVKIVVDHVLAGRPMPPWLATVVAYLPGAGTPRGLLVWSVGVALAVAVGGGALSLLSLSIGLRVCQRLVLDLLLDLFVKLQRLSLRFHSRHKIGDLLQRVSGDVLVVFFAVTQVALPIVVATLTLLGMFVVMLRLDAGLSFVALGVIPLLVGSLLLFAQPLQASSRGNWKSQGALMALVEQSLSGIKVIQGFARESYMLRKVEVEGVKLVEAGRRAALVTASNNQAATVITGAAAALMLYLGASRVMDGRLSLGDLLIFIGYLTALYGPVSALGTAAGYGIAVVTRSRRVFQILDSDEEVSERADAIVIKRARGEVVFEDVSFGYDDDAAILQSVSLTASPGQITAIVGATGAGKTSLVSLLSRFYDPQGGRILLDGHDLRDLSLKSLRENVSLVLQEPFLFPLSVADNIAFGRPGATRQEIVAAARAAHAHDFIEQLPEGYDTVLNERGGQLSGGERQRIAIARAVLKDAPVLILDEPTSALDAHTEGKIFEALSRLMKDRTTFIISHRLSTIRRADQILALEDGRVVERGTHESLLAAGRTYAHLYERQHIAAL
ncbi:MAG TPA: ABC transporter ATP-binding protein [Pyrinomonadaceae bacterium]|nr:ABC transporter ATP-binding protein [Pyrinomonadaceae bacterium]